MSIKVSIVVPVYNAENDIADCLETLVNQTLDEIEIILVNDCSTDGSLAILRDYERKYGEKVIIVDLKKNSGPGGARNAGLRVASGEYIGFTDSDDDVSLDMFSKMYKIASRADYDMVDCGFYYEEEDKEVTTTYKDAVGILTSEKRKKFLKSPGYIWSKIIKNSILTDNNIRFRENTNYEDLEFLSVASIYFNKICATNMPLYNYRMNSKSITHCPISVKMINGKIEGERALVNQFKDRGVYEEYKDIITYRIYSVYLNSLKGIIFSNEKINADIFRKLRDVFFELADADYKSNVYINEIDEKDRAYVDLNNDNCNEMMKNYLQLKKRS